MSFGDILVIAIVIMLAFMTSDLQKRVENLEAHQSGVKK